MEPSLTSPFDAADEQKVKLAIHVYGFTVGCRSSFELNIRLLVSSMSSGEADEKGWYRHGSTGRCDGGLAVKGKDWRLDPCEGRFPAYLRR